MQNASVRAPVTITTGRAGEEKVATKVFSLAEGETKLQKRVRCLRGFSNVSAGATGKVIHAAPADIGYEVAIRWDPALIVSQDILPVVIWIGKQEYETLLTEVE